MGETPDLILEEGPLGGKVVKQSATAGSGKMFILSKTGDHLYYRSRAIYGRVEGWNSAILIAVVYRYVKEAKYVNRKADRKDV